jgi:hypothetical protein
MMRGFDPITLSFPAAYAARYSSGRLSLPVHRNQVIYANFEHVAGVQASGTRGFSISKLKILDILIDRLSSIKKNPDARPKKEEAMSDERLDALISQYEKELHLYAVQASNPYVQIPAVEPGSLVSLSA